MSAPDDTLLRPARAEDRPALEALTAALQAYEAAFEPNRSEPEQMKAAYLDEVWRWAEARSGVVLVAEAAGRVLGFAVCGIGSGGIDTLLDYQRVGRITDLVVADDQRGRGLGKALIRACEAHLAAAGVGCVEVAALAGNNAACAAYAACGYRPYYVAHVRYLSGPLAEAETSEP